MVLVFLMLGSVVLGFFVGAFFSEFFKAEQKTATSYGKVIVCTIVVLVAAFLCLKKNSSYLLSLALGLMVGIAPYLVSKKTEDSEENKNQEER